VPRGIQAEIAALKGVVAAFVMAHNTRQPIYLEQRELLQELAEGLLAEPERMDTAFRTDWMPFAGRRQSGYGIGGIPWTMHEMTEQKMIVLRM